MLHTNDFSNEPLALHSHPYTYPDHSCKTLLYTNITGLIQICALTESVETLHSKPRAPWGTFSPVRTKSALLIPQGDHHEGERRYLSGQAESSQQPQ